MATERADPALKLSLKISSETSPSNPGLAGRHEGVDSQLALPRKQRMTAPGQVVKLSFGASHLTFGPSDGVHGIEVVPRASTWKLSSTSPTAG